MKLIGHGIDVVELTKFALLLADKDSDFLTRCFTSSEQRVAAQKEVPEKYLAGCFAFKEAVVKALGCGFDGKISPLEIELVHSTAGMPQILLSGEAKKQAERCGITQWLASKSDSGDLVIASVIAAG